LEVVSYAESTSIYKASIFYKVDRRHVQEWKAQKTQLEAIKSTYNLSDRKVRVLGGHGHKPKYLTLEQELVKYVKEKRDEGYLVTTKMLATKAKELAKALELGFTASGYKLPSM
ncbi:17818_t:CDS:2, partial [Dentiscutata erythropus]